MTTNFWQTAQSYIMRKKRQSLQQKMLGKMDSYVQKDETGILHHTPKSIQNLLMTWKLRPETANLLEVNMGISSLTLILILMLWISYQKQRK